jgi:hypothetical protein
MKNIYSQQMKMLSGKRRLMNRSLKKFRLPFLLPAALLGIYFSSVSLGGQEVDLLISPGKLSQPHAHLSGVANCSQCHTEKKKADPLKCLACHRDLAERITAGRGWHRGKKDGCITCHPEHQGEDFKLIDWDLKKFSHAETGFPLVGLHKKITDCAACHATANALPPRGTVVNALPRKDVKTYLLKAADCAACHPDPHRGQLGSQCARCHSVEAPFKQAAFDHGKSRFPLNGAHKSLACGTCHENQKWKGLAFSRCSDCHADPHRPSFGKECRACHQETSWRTSRFNHDQTRFPLRGKHSALACSQCHPDGGKGRKIAFANCSDCHRQDPHGGQFGTNCQDCHVVDGFEKVSFNHNNTRFPLTGKHLAVSCQKCHPKKSSEKTAANKPVAMACADCHHDVHLGQFAADCGACHSTRGFNDAGLKFNHQTASTFPLLGKHATRACQVCHKKIKMAFPAGNGETVLYKPLAAECIACHDDYHQGQLAKDCRQCHGFDSFRPAPGFDHNRSRFSLQLFHDAVGCRECHPLAAFTVRGKTVQTVQYKNISGECRDCHRDFDHSRTAFVLTGAHQDLDCRLCHNSKTPNVRKPGAAVKSETECSLCHRSPHLGLQKNCRECHSGKNWRVEQW